MGQCGHHVDLSPICLGKAIAEGIAATLDGTSAFSTFIVGVCIGGIGQSALALNRVMDAGMVLGQGVSSLIWQVVSLGMASDCGGINL